MSSAAATIRATPYFALRRFSVLARMPMAGWYG